jgi:F0F1-type ATP synthase delta subunit
MKNSIKSIFEQISEQVFRMTNLSEAQAFIVNFVNSKNINDKDKKNIIYETTNMKSLVRLQTYICNSLLKYEGMSVNFNRETTV